MIKKNFLTGLALLLPVVVTITIVVFLVNFLTKPFQSFVEELLGYYGIIGKPYLIHFLSKFLILFTIIATIMIVGLLTRIFITHYLIKFGDWIIHKIPIVNKIYKATQDVVKTLFAEKRQSFTQVVLAPFPHTNVMGIGMITNDCIPEESDSEHGGLISVFIPATPNPTMGFMLLLKREQLIFLDMKVDDALKAIISCGVMFTQVKEKALSSENAPL